MNLARELTAIAGEDLPALRARWQRLYGPPPRLRSVALLRQILGWRIQADVHGGLDPATRKLLRGRSAGAETTLAGGSVLTREWQGTIYRVEIANGGYLHDDRHWKSLSHRPSHHRHPLERSALLRSERPGMNRLRCAIYTRKSSKEGLEQEFNSLDAQREACLAYITSQKGEGWTPLPAHYDDGGWSGGNMERPGLQQQLRDIEAGRVDVVVVYKVDRLTRSLSDFARIVETFDSKQVSFASVTQAFNTTSSMGRLTLNVLLSFAQFEREVTGERIRDKIAASKAKGMWMGGCPPLGYRPDNRSLLIDPDEAELVRSIFTRYLELGSVHVLARQLEAEGVRSRSWTTLKGEPRGSAVLTRGKLFHLLRNRIYVGEIRHHDKVYPGLHEAILDRDLFDAVQAMLDRNIRRRKTATSDTAPLTGLLFDAAGHRMSPVHSRGRSAGSYRYYNSAPLQQGTSAKADTLRRIPAGPIEELLLERLRRWSGEPHSAWERFLPCLTRVEVHPRVVVIHFTHPANAPWQERIAEADEVETPAKGELRITVSASVRPRGGRRSVTIATDTKRAQPDRTLISGLRRAHAIAGDHAIDVFTRSPRIDEARGIDDPWSRKLVQLAFLAPDIQHAILIGRQPAGLTLTELVGEGFPLGWNVQREKFGFALHEGA